MSLSLCCIWIESLLVGANMTTASTKIWQLSPLEVRERQLKIGPKKLIKIQIHLYGLTKCFENVRHAKSNSGVYWANSDR